MEITKTIQPGDMGSKDLLDKYGERLVCVRYRIDRERRQRYKTIELIVDEKPLLSSRVETMAWIKVDFGEIELRQKIKSAGAKWLVDKKVWEMSYDKAKQFKLSKRIVKRFQKKEG